MMMSGTDVRRVRDSRSRGLKLRATLSEELFVNEPERKKTLVKYEMG